ncbi:MAG: twin-arginine translocation signal domain-containing protein, partial [Thermoguttaceae bacterium]|nr:twin-arginine translocation signal domain-containing protein [Thermoguttaceae bacterium]
MRVDNLPRRDFLKTASLFAGAAAVAPEKTF